MTDFAGYQAWLAQEQLVSFQSLAITTAGNNFGPVAMTGFDGLEVHVEAALQPIGVTVIWSADPSGQAGGLITSDPWILPAGMVLDVIIPKSGLFAFIEFQSLGAGTVNALVYAAPVNGAGGKFHWLTSNPEVLALNNTVAAGVTKIVPLPALVAGPCWAAVTPRDTAGQLQYDVITLNANGAISKRLWLFGTPTVPAGVMLQLPAQPAAMRIVNNDGVSSHSYDVILVPQLTP